MPAGRLFCIDTSFRERFADRRQHLTGNGIDDAQSVGVRAVDNIAIVINN